MPGADEGAFERFIASALATILTIIFSWQIIIDVYDDSKRRRQIESGTPSPTTTSGTNFAFPKSRNNLPTSANNAPSTSSAIVTSSAVVTTSAVVTPSTVVTSSKECQKLSQIKNTKLSSLIKEYRLTPGTISRLAAVPDPIDIQTHSAEIDNKSLGGAGAESPRSGSPGAVRRTGPVLSDRNVPESDAFDPKPLNRDLLRVVNSRKLLASPDDFDSVPLDEEDLVESNNRVSVSDSVSKINCDIDGKKSVKSDKKKGRRNMFDESWEMDEPDEDFREIYGEEDVDRQNPRDIYFVPLDDSSDDEHYWPKRMLEAISEEDEDDLSSSEYESESDKDEDHFSDDSLDVEDGSLSSPKDQNLNSIRLLKCTESSLIEQLSDCKTMDNDILKDPNFDLSVETETPVSVVTTSQPSGCHDNQELSSNESSTPAFSDGGTKAMDVKFTRQKISELNTLFASHESEKLENNRYSPSLNDQARQLCTSLEGLNRLDPSLCSVNDSGIIGRVFYKDISSMDTTSKFLNGDINISNFDDSKLELLDDSYKDSLLSDCTKPVPRGFIFSHTEDLDSSKIVSSNFVPKDLDSCDKKSYLLSDTSGGPGEPSGAPLQEENQNGGDQYYQPRDKYKAYDSTNSSLIHFQTEKNDNVYVIDLNSDNSDAKENSDIHCERVTNELLAQEQILDSRIVISNGDNSSGDESSTTTGETAILNPANREVTDDDVSEIGDIDIDVINELRKVASERTRGHSKHQVTDLDASSSDSETSEPSVENSDSSASFEFNEDTRPEPEPINRNRNLAVVVELVEELSTSETSSGEFEDAETEGKIELGDLASSGSGSSPDEVDFHNPSSSVEKSSPAIVNSHTIHTVDQVDSTEPAHYKDKSLISTDSKLSKSPYFHTLVDDTPKLRTIVRRNIIYPGMEQYPELGFFKQPEWDEKGTQTTQSYRQPAKCTIDPERYFRPFKVDRTPYKVTTEFSTGEIEVKNLVEVGIQIRFDPLWDKSEQQLVLSPSATPTRGSPVNVEREGKLQQKELFFQWPEKASDSVFEDNFEPVSVTVNLASVDTQRKRRTSCERRPSYEAIDESEEDFLEDTSVPILDMPPKGTPPRGKSQDLRSKSDPKSPRSEEEKQDVMKPEFGVEVIEFTTIKSSDHPSPNEGKNEPVVQTNETKQNPSIGAAHVLAPTKVSSKTYDRKVVTSDSEEDVEDHRSPPKRRHRRSKTPTSPQLSPLKGSRNSLNRNSSSEDEKAIIEKVHIADSSDADDESDDEARVPLFSKNESPLVSPSEPKPWHPPSTSTIEPISSPKRLSPSKSPVEKRDSPSPNRIQISPRPRPIPQPRVRTADFISTTRVSPVEAVKSTLYNQFNRPQSPPKYVSETHGQRVQSALSIQLQSSTRPTPLARTQMKVDTESLTVAEKTEVVNAPPPLAQPPANDSEKMLIKDPISPKKYTSALTEPINTENRNISHLFPLPDKAPQLERERLHLARTEYMKQKEKNEEERKRLLSRLLGTRDWNEREVPKPKSILKKPSQTFENKQDDLPLGYRPTSLDTPNLAKMCKSTENIKERISRVVERRREEDRERSRSRSNGRSSEFERGRPERRSCTLPANFNAPSRAKSLDSLIDNRSLTLPRCDSRGNLYRSPSMTLNKDPISFFSDRKSYTNLLETDLDNQTQKAVPLIKETDLDSVSKNSNSLYRERSKSETRDSVRRPVVKEVYEDHLEKTKSMEQLSENTTISISMHGGTPEVVPVNRDAGRLSKSLGQLDLPDWYVNAPRRPEDVDFGLQCTKTPPSSTSTSFDHSKSFRSNNTSFDTGPRTTVLVTRVTPPRRSPSPKAVKNFELPSEKFRKANIPMTTRRIVSKMRPPGSKSMENLTTKEMSAVSMNITPKSDGLSPFSVSSEKEKPNIEGEITGSKLKVGTPKMKVKPMDFTVANKPVEVKKSEVEIWKPEGETKRPESVANNSETRFKSSASLQLKPNTPPKPLSKPAPPPRSDSIGRPTIPARPSVINAAVTPKLETQPSRISSTFETAFDEPAGLKTAMGSSGPKTPDFALFGPPPPIPSSGPPAPLVAEVPRVSTNPFDIPFVDESPEDEAPKLETFAEPPNFESEPPRPQFTSTNPFRTMIIPDPQPFTIHPAQTDLFKEPLKSSQTPLEMPRSIAVTKPVTAEIQMPSSNPFITIPTVEMTIEAPKETPIISQPNLVTSVDPKVLLLNDVDHTTKPIETDIDKPAISETKLRLQSPYLKAACEPLMSKPITTTPTQFYALNCIETDLDTSATMSPPRARSPDLSNEKVDYMKIAVDDLTSGSNSSRENVPLERKWAPHESNVGAMIRRGSADQPAPIETNIDAPRSPRVLDEPTPRSPRETSFVSKPSPKVESNPSSPRETSFLSKGKERSHFVFPKPASNRETIFGLKETNFASQETNLDGAYQSRRPTDFRVQQDYNKVSNGRPAENSRATYQTPKSLAAYQRPLTQPLETSIDSASPLIKRNERQPPANQEPSPIPNYGRPVESNIDAGWKTSTPAGVRNQNYRQQRLPSKETNIDADIVQQPLSPPVQFERSLDNDSFRFNSPQSESTPLNLSLESNTSIRGQMKNNTVFPKLKETDIDADIMTARPISGRGPAPPPPVRRTGPLIRPANPPPTRLTNAPPTRLTNSLPARSNHAQPSVQRRMETDIDSDLNGRDVTDYVHPNAAPAYQNGPRPNGGRMSQTGLPSRQNSTASRPGSVASHTGSLSDGYFDPGDLDTFKRMAREDPLVSTSSPRASPLDANFNAFGLPCANSFATNVRIDHSKNIYQPKKSLSESPSDPESPQNTSLVEVLDGLLGMEQSPRNNTSDDFSDPDRKRTISEAKFDIFNDINMRLNEDLTMVKCRNSRCGKTLPMRQARTVFVSCTICYCYYCSEDCRSKHFPRHEQRCTFSKVENSCRLIVRRLKTDPILSHQISGLARTGYHSRGRGCVTITLESPLQCDQVVNAGRAALQSQPIYCPMCDFDSELKIADNAMDLVVDYNPNLDFVLNVCCMVTRRTTELVRYAEVVSLTSVQMPTIAVNDRQPREQWFYSLQNKLRERGVDLRRQYPDVYNQIIQYVDRKSPFQPITIYPVDGNTGKTFLCSISPDTPVDIRPMTWNKSQLGRAPQAQRIHVPAQVTFQTRPMYQPPRRSPNATSKETEL